jgi:hypothetical protein
MITEKTNIKCESVFDDAHTHRYLWKRVWQKEKPLAAVICLQPSLSDNIIQDTTTALIVNNIARLDTYGGVVILNLYSMLTNKLSFRFNSDEELSHKENDDYIVKAAQECDTIVLAWGKGGNTNERIAKRAEQVIQMLLPYEDKLYVITDGERSFLHPLTPQIRQSWELVKFDPHVDREHQEGRVGTAAMEKSTETTDDKKNEQDDDDATLS